MENDVLNHKKAVTENIMKSFSTDIQKAHYHGEIHKNGKWYWNSQAAGGKGDWRVIKNQGEQNRKTAATTPTPITNKTSQEDIKKLAKEFLDNPNPNFDTLYEKYGFETSVNEYNRVRNEVAKIINGQKKSSTENKKKGGFNISPETISKLEKMGYLLAFQKKSDLQPHEPEDSDFVTVIRYDENGDKRIRIDATQQELTVDKVLEKFNLENIYVDFSQYFEKLLGLKHSIDVYPTTYGIGISTFTRSGNKELRELIKQKLDSLGIKYSCEFSDAAWVYRIKIAKNAENIARIKELINGDKTIFKEKMPNLTDSLMNKMLNFTSYKEKDYRKRNMAGIYFENGKAIATDGFSLVILKCNYPKQYENKIIGKDKKEIDEKFPNWKSILTEQDKSKEVNVDVKKVIKAVKNIKKIEGLDYTGIKIGDSYYNAQRLSKFLDFQPDIKIFQSDKKYLLFKNDVFTGVMTPLTTLSDNDDYNAINQQADKVLYTVDDALEYVPKPVIEIENNGKKYKAKVIGNFKIQNKNFDIVYIPKLFGIYSVTNGETVEGIYPNMNNIDYLKEITEEKVRNK